MKKFIQILSLLACFFSAAISAAAYCSYYDPPKGTEKYTNLDRTIVTLEEDTRFKIAMMHELDAEFSKTGDYVQFKVLEDVYGIACEYDRGKATELNGRRVLVIKKETTVFGTVDRAKPGYPFYLGGKSKLFIFVSEVVLESGYKIPIQFALPKGNFFANLTQKQKEKIRQECKIADTTCITGRRAKFKVSTAVLASVLGTIAGFIEDVPTGLAVGALTFVQNATEKAETMLHAPHARLFGNKSIYEVATIGGAFKGFVLKTKDEREALVKWRTEQKDAVDPQSRKKRELEDLKLENELNEQRKKLADWKAKNP